jgi:hypothetical protein
MPNTRTADLTAASAAVSTDCIPCAISPFGTTNSRKLTNTQLATHATTAPVLAAGTASANTWPKFTAGTVLTTPEVGALELDASCLYGTTDAGNRGAIPFTQYVRSTGTISYANSGTAQAMFKSPTNGRITVEAGVYIFQSFLSVSSMDAAATSNLSFSIAGTATIGNITWSSVGIDGNTGTAASQSGNFKSATSAGAVAAGVANANVHARILGMIDVSVAGTLIPSITLAVAAAAVGAVAMFFTCTRVGATGAVTLGQWD